MTRVVVVLFCVVSLVPAPATGQAVSCADFDAFEWAQSVYEADPARYAELDPDGDGVACPELPNGAAPALWIDAIPEAAEPVQLGRVVDGDTADFVLADGAVDRVRFLLVDTPEVVDPVRPVACFGQEATAFTTWLLSIGGDLYLERDVTERDRFGRLLRYVWLDLDGEVYLVNEALARSGYGQPLTSPPDVRYADEIRDATAFARRHELGLWGACESFGAPVATPTPTPAPVVQQTPPAPGDRANCDPSYPTVCIPHYPPDLNCGDIPFRRFEVLPPDPHGFDGDHDGVGCERD